MKTLHNVPRVLLALFTVSLLAIVSVGCGDSRDDFVATNTNNATTGNLVFQLQQAVTQTTVPAGTTNVLISLFSTDPPTEGSLLFSDTFAFAPVITVTGVPSNAVSATVTALNSDGLPTAVFTVSVQVTVGGTNTVDSGTAVQVTFSGISVTPDPVNLVVGGFGTNPTDQQQLTITGTLNDTAFQLPINAEAVSFTPNMDQAANISASGLVTTQFPGLTPSNVTVTVEYTFLGVARTDTFLIASRFFGVTGAASTNLGPGGTYDSGYAATFTGSDTVFVPGVADALTFALESPVTGVTVNASTGVVTTSASTPVGSFNVVATWVDNTRPGATGLTFTDTIVFNVANAG